MFTRIGTEEEDEVLWDSLVGLCLGLSRWIRIYMNLCLCERVPNSLGLFIVEE